MSKYIPADKLMKSVNNYQEGAKAAFNPIENDADYYKGKIDACKDIKEFISSLQQEQPEVELEKEIDDYWEKICDDEFGELIARERETAWFDDIAHHFYELGLNARK